MRGDGGPNVGKRVGKNPLGKNEPRGGWKSTGKHKRSTDMSARKKVKAAGGSLPKEEGRDGRFRRDRDLLKNGDEVEQNGTGRRKLSVF